jgi:anti-sigma B factor antagonist
MRTSHAGAPDGVPGISQQLTIRLEPDPTGVCIRLEGELDLATAPEVDRLLDDLAERDHARLLIDLTGVEFMDSAGLASIIRALHAAELNGHRLTVRPGSAQVQRLFELTGLLDRLSFES